MSIHTPQIEFTAGVAEAYTDHLAAGIGSLMPDLDETFPADPIPRERLEDIITDPNYDQIVVVKHELITPQEAEEADFDDLIAEGEIAVAATMSIVKGAGFGKRGQLEDFVTGQQYQGRGLGKMAWRTMVDWCTRNGFEGFYFQTETFRPDAVAFYDKRGAKKHDETIHYSMDVKDLKD